MENVHGETPCFFFSYLSRSQGLNDAPRGKEGRISGVEPKSFGRGLGRLVSGWYRPVGHRFPGEHDSMHEPHTAHIERTRHENRWCALLGGRRVFEARRVVTCTTGEADGWIYLKLELLHYPFSLDLVTFFFLYFYHRSSRIFFFFFFEIYRSLSIPRHRSRSIERTVYSPLCHSRRCAWNGFSPPILRRLIPSVGRNVHTRIACEKNKRTEVLALEFL